MGQRIHALAQHLFRKTTVEECDLKEVQNLANKYPYFAPAQLLLLQKLKSENTEAYDIQLQKAILYYPNPLEFQLLVDEERFNQSHVLQAASLETESNANVDEDNAYEESHELQAVSSETESKEVIDEYNDFEERHELQTAGLETESKVDADEYNGYKTNDFSERENENAITQSVSFGADALVAEKIFADEDTEKKVDSNTPDLAIPNIELGAKTTDELITDTNLKESTAELEESIYENPVEKNNSTEINSNFLPPELAPLTEDKNDIHPTPNQKIETTNTQAPAHNENDFPQNLKHKTQNLEPSAFAEPMADKQTSNAEEPIAFEPYYTVDYFASQGIKISGNEIPKDKFGKQLKSFTEWLKTMKRLPATQVSATLDAASENKVENLAAHSVDETNVFTEAMAEVWLKQGNPQKATEVYHKLSLLYPAKRAFFAAKIENLKH